MITMIINPMMITTILFVSSWSEIAEMLTRCHLSCHPTWHDFQLEPTTNGVSIILTVTIMIITIIRIIIIITIMTSNWNTTIIIVIMITKISL